MTRSGRRRTGGRDLGLRRRRRLPPVAGVLLSISGGMLAVYAGTYIEKKLRVDDAVGAVAVRGVCGFYGVFLVGIFAGGYPTGINNVESSFGGQLMGMMAFLPLAFIPGYVVSWILKKLNLLRVPAEVELEGLDLAEFGQDFYPEFGAPRIIIEPDGREVDGAPILLDAYWQTNGKAETPVGTERGARRCSTRSRSTSGARTSLSSGRSAARARPGRGY